MTFEARRSLDGGSTSRDSLKDDSNSYARSRSCADLAKIIDTEELPGFQDLSRCLSFSASEELHRHRVTRLLRRRNFFRSQSVLSVNPSVIDCSLVALDELPSEKVIMVSNRLPVSAVKTPDGEWELAESAGGLVSALKGVQNSFRTTWIGWPGIFVQEGPDRDALTRKLTEQNFIPVWLNQDLISDFYNGYCNNILWPLFHYVPLSIESWHSLAGTHSMENQSTAYEKANRVFAEHVLKYYDATDPIIWVHDYHLMLLPDMLKKQNSRMKVGWFLHTPFPSSEIYRTLPGGDNVLRSVLAADLLGFHTYDYARHFISSCSRILGVEGTPIGVEYNGHTARVITCPIGTNVERFRSAAAEDVVKQHVQSLRQKFHGRRVLLGVDRLDMIKGIPQKLLAYEKFLEEHPKWRSKVLFVQVAVPTRADVHEYQRLSSMVHEMVGRINGKYGSVTQMPIHFLNQSLDFYELVALYIVTDVALITSLRDGMNLVSFEYVACQSNKPEPGGLILSEFAGAAQSLGAGSLLVNPWNTTEMAQAIHESLNMKPEERSERHQENYQHISTHTAQAWAETFITELNDSQLEADLRERQSPPAISLKGLVNAYHDSRSRLFVLGYNATLTTASEVPRSQRRHYDNMRQLARVHPTTFRCIIKLTEDPKNTVMIFSGSERSRMEDLFRGVPVWLIAENGVFMKPPHGVLDVASEWIPLFDSLRTEWMNSVKLVFDYFYERTPRSFVEARETSLVWNYKYADVEFGRIQANDLLQHLRSGPISNESVDIIPGARSVEVRPKGLTKGLAMQHIIGRLETLFGVEAICFDFALCVGHFVVKDENIFEYFEGKNLCKETRFEGRSSYSRMSYTAQEQDESRQGQNGIWGRCHSPASDGRESVTGMTLPVIHPHHLFTCTVGRNISIARYSLPGSEEVAEILAGLVRSTTTTVNVEVFAADNC